MNDKNTTHHKEVYKRVTDSIEDRINALYELGYCEEEVTTIVNDILFYIKVTRPKS